MNMIYKYNQIAFGLGVRLIGSHKGTQPTAPFDCIKRVCQLDCVAGRYIYYIYFFFLLKLNKSQLCELAL